MMQKFAFILFFFLTPSKLTYFYFLLNFFLNKLLKDDAIHGLVIQNKLGKSIFECDFDGLVSLNSFNKCGNITIQSSHQLLKARL